MQEHDASFDHLVDSEGSGYIVDGGSLIVVAGPKLDTLNNYAYDVIQHQVKDHFEVSGGQDEADFDKLKVSLFQALEKNAQK